ncbi:flagellar biosynthesis protein FlgC [Streptococcus anginosus]|uniref:flagellar biosynthesis protein FlgC n=1 Tax=Streptococcus anginosus TaxID=1328 RepID=UPI00124903E0|nr:flagellar biosynthesis protein FlgC [Streptococcus anginosus]KAA9248189.1 flagellar biosynthesis protein FlgC [Streptococcus anginosus]KAA9309752.1 flagellar biosynthesis protein FlgC [Streptococcus anginosus]MCW1026881.1 flagellar biosynthesis protein FlgC [Streptococcus anginosus]MCW1033492.1 flagellar biosynthesis protein FlgC [Streptococcus anginosus]MED5878122.1 flagellar biosynthesis protein FlgC [Streptococcus anginosus]
MIDDIIPELNDLQTLATAALVYDDNLNTSQAVLRLVEQKIPRIVEILEELDNGKI